MTHKGATIETTGTGDTTIIAGGSYRQTGSAVTAANGDVSLDAQQIEISSVNDRYSSQTTTVVKESGSLTTENTALSEIASELAEATALLGQSNVERINDLAQATVDYLTTKKKELEAAIAKQSDTEGDDAKTTTVRTVEKTTTTTSSNSQDTAKSSTVTASGEVSVVASGDANSSIRMIGSEVIGESGTYLTADGDIALLSAEQSQGSTNHREMSGVAFGVTQVADKVISAYSEAEVSHATAVSSGTTHHHSHIGSYNSQTTIKSGGKLTIKGAQVVGKGVKLDADELHIESVQDTYTYSGSESSQKITHLGDGESTAATAIKTKVSDYQVSADYASVNQQSGVVAGDLGFQVNIVNHTTIKGGIITGNAQAQAAGNNQFTTGTLSISDINNHSSYSASGSETVNHVQISGEHDKSYKDNGMGFGQTSGGNSSVTRAGIGTAAIRITDETKQRGIQADVLSNPQTAQTNQTGFVAGGIANSFNADAVKQEVKTQIAVTKTAGQWMPYEVANYAEAQMARYEKAEEIIREIKPLLDKNLHPDDREKATSLVKQAEEIVADKAGNYDAWKEGGDKRVAMHAEVGYRLTGTEEGGKSGGNRCSTRPEICTNQGRINRGTTKVI